MAPYAVNWQVKESPIAAGSEVRTDLKKLVTLIRLSGYRGYIPIETLSARGAEYDPFQVVPKFFAELREAVKATASVEPPPGAENRPPLLGAGTPPAGTSPPPSTAATPAATAPAATTPTDPPRKRKPPNKNKNRPQENPT